MGVIYRLMLTLILSLHLITIYAENENPFFFSHLDVEDGLSQVSILSIFQDSEGYIWFGTRNGANRYDGYEFKVYQRSIIDNAQALCNSLINRGIKIVSGGTDNHLMLVDLTPFDLTGKAIEKMLDEAHITANKNTIPNDPKSPFVTSGIRLGTPAVTSRGMNAQDMDQIAEAIELIIKGGEEKIPQARAIVQTLTDKYPLI